MSCAQCHGCAYKPGSAANLELNNRLNGLVCALGGMPFFCHDSLKWNELKRGYNKRASRDLSVLLARNSLVKLGVPASVISEQTEETRRNLRLCSGWKESVARLKAQGWFENPEVNAYRRYMAKRTIQAINDLVEPFVPVEDEREYIREIQELVSFFVAESKNAAVDIRWLLEPAT